MVPEHSRIYIRKKLFKIASFLPLQLEKQLSTKKSTHDVMVLHVKIRLIDRTFCNMNLMNVAEPVIKSVVR